MFCNQVVISSLGATRIHRGLVDFPALKALKASAKTTHGTECAGEHNREPVRPHSWRTTKRIHDTEDVECVLNAPPVTTCSTEVHKEETFEGSNIV